MTGSLIGNTPLVEIEHGSPEPGVRLFAKLEGQNPTGCVEDPILAFMLEQARERGTLPPGQEIVAASTGNTGIALAMIGAPTWPSSHFARWRREHPSTEC